MADFLGALKRAITLPKGRNSLSDILKADRLTALQETVRVRVIEGVTVALGHLTDNAWSDIFRLREAIREAVLENLSHVSPLLEEKVRVEMDRVLNRYARITPRQIVGVAEDVADAVFRALKV